MEQLSSPGFLPGQLHIDPLQLLGDGGQVVRLRLRHGFTKQGAYRGFQRLRYGNKQVRVWDRQAGIT